MRRPAAAHRVARTQAAADPANVSVKGEAQAFTSLQARLTDVSAADARPAAVTAIGQVTKETDPAANLYRKVVGGRRSAVRYVARGPARRRQPHGVPPVRCRRAKRSRTSRRRCVLAKSSVRAMRGPVCCAGPTVSQTAARSPWRRQKRGDKLTGAVDRPLAAHLETQNQAATGPEPSCDGRGADLRAAESWAHLRQREGGPPDRSNCPQTGGRE